MSHIISYELIQDFQKYLHNDEKSKNTIEKYMRDLKRFSEFVQGKVIDKGLVMEYKSMLTEQHTFISVNSMIAAVNAFLKYMGWIECCVKQYKIQHQPYCSEDKELSKQEYTRLVNTAKKQGNKRLSLIIQTICGTGIRVSELQFITVEALRKGEATVNCKGKTRMVFIVKDLQKILLAYAKKEKISSGPIFITRKGNPVNRCNIWRDMKALCEQANVNPNKVFPHNLRHLFARVFYKIDKDIAKLADILGHSNINTTRLYIVSSGKEHQRKIEMMRLVI